VNACGDFHLLNHFIFTGNVISSNQANLALLIISVLIDEIPLDRNLYIKIEYKCFYEIGTNYLQRSITPFLGTIPAATAEDIDIAVNAARAAFHRNKGQDWARASGKYRAKFLRAIAAKVSCVLSNTGYNH
jgi:hypothetical protein